MKATKSAIYVVFLLVGLSSAGAFDSASAKGKRASDSNVSTGPGAKQDPENKAVLILVVSGCLAFAAFVWHQGRRQPSCCR